MKYACPKGHTTNIQGTAWIDLNTGEPTGDDAPTDQNWCGTCSEEDGDGEFGSLSVMPDEAAEIGAFVDGYTHGLRSCGTVWISWADAHELRPLYDGDVMECFRNGIEDGANGDPFRLDLTLAAIKADPVPA